MKRRILAPWLFLTPFLIVQAVFFLFAVGRAVYFSFTDYNMFNEPGWVGFRNYANLFAEANFLTALWNTLSYALIVTVSQTFLALGAAVFLNRKLRGIRFFQASFYLPSVASSVVITLIFLWLFQRNGAINYAAAWLAAHGVRILFFLATAFFVLFVSWAYERLRGFPAKLFDPALSCFALLAALVVFVVVSILGFFPPVEVGDPDFVWLQTRDRFLGVSRPLWAIIIQNVFTTVPTLMLLFLAGLQDVSQSLYEAAKIDGAGPVTSFFRITIPALRPVMFLVVTMSLIGTLQMFDQVAIYGDAVPFESVVTLAYFVYNRMFPGAQLPEVGLASSAALFLAFFTLALVALQRLFLKDKGDAS